MKVHEVYKNDLLDRSIRFFDDEAKTNRYVDDHTSLNPYNSLMPSWSNAYYAYNGSMTVPECDKDVLWILMKKPVDITFAQLQEYRSLISAVGSNVLATSSTAPYGVTDPWNVALGTNNRKIATLDGRTVLEFPKPSFQPRVAEDWEKKVEMHAPNAELQVKTISKGVSVTFVGCAVAAVSTSVLLGYLLGRTRRTYDTVSEAHDDDSSRSLTVGPSV